MTDDLGEYDPRGYPQKLTFTVLIDGDMPALRLISAKDALAAGLGIYPDKVTLVVERATEADIYVYGI